MLTDGISSQTGRGSDRRRAYLNWTGISPICWSISFCDSLQLREKIELNFHSSIDHARGSSALSQSDIAQQPERNVGLAVAVTEVARGSVCADQHLLRHYLGDQLAILVGCLL